MVGKPVLPPFWSLGWMAGSSNYTELSHYDEMVSKYSDHKIPLEGVLLDNQYLASADFLIGNTENFSGLK